MRQSPLYEVVGQLGFWGTIINGVQAAGLEHKGIRDAPWTGAVVGLLLAYTAGEADHLNSTACMTELVPSHDDPIHGRPTVVSARVVGLL